MAIPDEEKAERVRKTYEAFNRGDFDAALEIAHPDIVFTRPGGQSELRGAEALRAWMERDAFESQTTELQDFEFAGNRVLVTQRTVSRRRQRHRDRGRSVVGLHVRRGRQGHQVGVLPRSRGGAGAERSARSLSAATSGSPGRRSRTRRCADR